MFRTNAALSSMFARRLPTVNSFSASSSSFSSTVLFRKHATTSGLWSTSASPSLSGLFSRLMSTETTSRKAEYSMPAFPVFDTVPPPRGIGGGSLNRMLEFNDLKPIPGSMNREKRLGRGPGSSSGKRCGKGQKGAKPRSGYARKPWDIGGQTPLYRRLPKVGFKNTRFQTPNRPLNIDKLVNFIREGRIDHTKVITLKDLWNCNIVGRFKFGVKLLGRGYKKLYDLNLPLHIEVTQCSSEAQKCVEKMGGTVKRVYFTRVGLRAHLKPNKYHPNLLPGNGLPKNKKMWMYDLDPEVVASRMF